MASCPALLITAAASGQGKTTVTAALARLHARQGRRVRVFKCGPDFLDPQWHQAASGEPVHQLDLWMTGEQDVRARLHAAALEADLILVEGVMGLFDGTPSAADLAERLGLPVLAVVDASAMAGTFGALALGLQHYRPGLRWAGVLANRVASERHAQLLQEGLRTPEHWLGALMRVSVDEAAKGLLPERHLGLVTAQELADRMQRLDAAADALAATPLGRMTLQDWQRWAVDFAAPAAEADIPPLLAGRTVAVARDAAFCFIYEANIDCLRRLGAQVVFFSPLQDAALPPCDALWLPGGYPELHVERLAANAPMRAAIAAHVAQGKPVWAECGGMMALCDAITLADGMRHSAWGLLPGEVRMQRRLAALGPQRLDLDGDAQGEVLRGHTFHYSTLESSAAVRARTARPDGMPGAGEAVYRHGSIHASYFHAWFPSSPAAVARLLGQ
jgi:cobyrinic acid a,c-diamide synthase